MTDAPDNGPPDRRTSEPPATDDRFSVPLCGVALDDETRCTHYDSDRDVVALRFVCCDTYYPCIHCHSQLAGHNPERLVPDRFDEPAVLCGACRTRLSATAYLSGDDACPVCDAEFNRGCRRHRDHYFAVGE